MKICIFSLHFPRNCHQLVYQKLQLSETSTLKMVRIRLCQRFSSTKLFVGSISDLLTVNHLLYRKYTIFKAKILLAYSLSENLNNAKYVHVHQYPMNKSLPQSF